MNKDGNALIAPLRKSAKSEWKHHGEFPPHGDSSIYDAMVRMFLWLKNRDLLMHGTNGSMDDPPAAMLRAEARLSEMAGYLLQDIEKDTVPFAWNFDDTEKRKADCLPAAFS